MVVQWADEIINSHVRDARLADIGGLWGLVNEKITVAVEAGCRAATMIDIAPINHRLWSHFEERALSMGVTKYQNYRATWTIRSFWTNPAPSTLSIAPG